MTIEQEIKTAKEKYGSFNSTHEVYGVLIEEVQEFWDIVREQGFNQLDDINAIELTHKKARMIHELTQISAISQRAIKELENLEIKWV